ncbi:MAG: fibronectin type III domain-containing protein [Micrococcales bacterium]|nr:fibronectin type III domain-containing protein [Micrococcales bacterium]
MSHARSKTRSLLGLTLALGVLVPVGGSPALAVRTCPPPLLTGGRFAPSAVGCVVPSRSTLPAPSLPKATRVSQTALKVAWKKVPGANGYRIDVAKSEAGPYRTAVTLTKGSTTSWTMTALKPGSIRFFKVRAFLESGGTKVFSKPSPWVSAVANKKRATLRNVTKIIGFPSGTLGVGGRDGLYYSPFGDGQSKKLGKTRYEIVSGKGIVRMEDWYSLPRLKGAQPIGLDLVGVKPGTAKIRAIAHNGVTATATIKVKDFTQPAAFVLSPSAASSPLLRALLIDLKEPMTRLASLEAPNYQRSDVTRVWELDEKGNLPQSLKLGPGASEIDTLRARLLTAYPYTLTILDGPVFRLSDPSSTDSRHYDVGYHNGLVPNNLEAKAKERFIAPHWTLDQNDGFIVLASHE